MFINTYKCEYLKGTVMLRIPYELDTVFFPVLLKNVPTYLPECNVEITLQGSSNMSVFVYNCKQIFNLIKYHFVAV